MKNSTPTKKNHPEKELQTRRVTVYGKIYPRANGRYVYYPEIRLAGKWLQNTGFKPEMKVKITCANRKLIITVETEKNTYSRR